MNSELSPNLDPRKGGRFKVPTILQMEATECGAACLGMILASHGRWIPLEELRMRCGVSRDGSKALNMIKVARDLGMHAKGYRRDLKRIYDIPFPMIIFWSFNHFVVLEGIKGESVYIVDPGEGPRKITMQEFDRAFTGVCLGFEPGLDFRPGGRKSSVWRGLYQRLGAARLALFFVIAATFFLIIPGLAIPTISKVFVDDVLIRQSGTWMLPLLIGLGVAAVMRAVLTWLQQHCLARMETKLSLVTTAQFFRHMVTLPMTFFNQRYAGDLSNRVMSNDSVARLISGQLATSAVGMITMIFYAAVMFTYDILLSLVAFAMAGINLLALRLVMAARENSQRRLLKEQGTVAGVSVSGVQMIETLKASGAENNFFSRWAGVHANSLIAQQKLGLYTNLLNVVPPALTAFNNVAILGVGSLRILDGVLTIGGLVAFQSLTQSFSKPINGLVQFGAGLQTVKGDIARLDDVLNFKPDIRIEKSMDELEPSGGMPPARGSISLENVTFGYNAKEPPLIENLNLTIKPGQRVALVGGSGDGKSTVAKLVCGLLTPWSGSVRIDEQVLEDIPASDFIATLSYVDQNIFLFEGSVRDNVVLWDPTIDMQALSQALHDAAILEVIMSRPNKMDAQVEEGGRNFSGGERQRLEIARAIVRDPTVLVLDEATAALDPLTEIEIDERMRQRGCTCLIIAHRLSTIRDADEIIVLDNGRIAQSGTHEDLIKEEGVYKSLITAG